MKEIINLTSSQICVRANYNTKNPNLRDKNIKPSPEAIKVAHETLSDLGWKLYSNFINFNNYDVGVAPITSLMNELEMTYEQFTKALSELVRNHYLNFRPIPHFDKMYTGNAFQFHADNSLVVICPTDNFADLNKPFAYTGTAEVKETF